MLSAGYLDRLAAAGEAYFFNIISAPHPLDLITEEIAMSHAKEFGLRTREEMRATMCIAVCIWEKYKDFTRENQEAHIKKWVRLRDDDEAIH
ncbi:hypothetical protein [Mesorhizobium sp. IMUNJ 23232]|uniref:hypothetical protein n=1 Tax=Mesorhizobium sp. IMUNJ 23232 TaxID=3376064 RepID=UPI0037AF1F34